MGIGGKIKDLYEDEKRRIAEKVRGPACRRQGNSQHRWCTLTSAETTMYVHDEGGIYVLPRASPGRWQSTRREVCLC